MSQFVSNTDLFVHNILQFDTNNINVEYVPISIPEAKFGILNLKAVSTHHINEDDNDIIFMVDCSGSMSDECSDGENKMHHILHTIKNIILYFKEKQSIKVHITIDAFDNTVYRILDRSCVNEHNYASIIEKINTISPRYSTDIQLALNSVKNTSQIIKNDFPNNNIVVIFMTDGKVTSGSSEHSILSKNIDRSITNAFIGFGIEHDANLLNALSNGENSAYYFIDKLENSGLVYGEILHGIIYKILKDVKISIKNGLIYDFKNNIWVEMLYIGDICSEANKIYHIASSNPDNCIVTLSANRILCSHENTRNVNINISKIKEYADHTKYIYRQRTLQHLYIASDYIKRKNITDNIYKDELNRYYYDYEYNSQLLKDESIIKKNLRKFIREMKNYIKENNNEDDKFMLNLCDDICICYKTIGTKFNAMYTYSRHSSQGTQRYYTVTSIPESTQELYPNTKLSKIQPPILTRQTNQISNNQIRVNVPIFDFETIQKYNDECDPHWYNNTENLFDDDLQHIVADCGDTPYLTPTATQIMRDISSGTNRCDIFSQDNEG